MRTLRTRPPDSATRASCIDSALLAPTVRRLTPCTACWIRRCRRVRLRRACPRHAMVMTTAAVAFCALATATVTQIPTARLACDAAATTVATSDRLRGGQHGDFLILRGGISMMTVAMTPTRWQRRHHQLFQRHRLFRLHSHHLHQLLPPAGFNVAHAPASAPVFVAPTAPAARSALRGRSGRRNSKWLSVALAPSGAVTGATRKNTHPYTLRPIQTAPQLEPKWLRKVVA